MVRTKDLVLIVTVLVMLMMAISATLTVRFFEAENNPFVFSEDQAPPSYGVATEEDENSDFRQSTIERLRAKLSEGDVINASPSVEAPLPEEGATVSSDLVRCPAAATGIDTARNWPLDGVDVKTIGNSRFFSYAVYSSSEPKPAGTSTQDIPKLLSETTYLTLPLVPTPLQSPICPDSEIVGVTTEGSLMFNADAVLYRNTSPATLIGYARDGYPIYGAYLGEVDECGGYQSEAGYRYTVRADNNKLLSCFIAQPQPFVK